MQPTLDKLERTKKLIKIVFGCEVGDTDSSIAHRLLRKYYPEGLARFKDFITRFDQLDAQVRTNPGPSAAIPEPLGGLEDSPMFERIIRGSLKCMCHGGLSTDPGPGLYRCSACAKSSALARECGRCHKAW